MIGTEADRDFYAAAEAAFIRRRGTPFLLSPKDFALLKEWRALGVPVEAIEKGIEDAFSRREERGAVGRINSLSYCRDAVLAAWERRAEARVGRGDRLWETEPQIASALERLGEKLGEIAARRPDLAGCLEAARRSAARLASSGRGARQIEVSLARLDKKLAGCLRNAMPEAEQRRLREEAAQRVSAARGRMDDLAAQRTAHALERRMLRERLDLPRLTLLP